MPERPAPGADYPDNQPPAQVVWAAPTQNVTTTNFTTTVIYLSPTLTTATNSHR